MCLVFVAVFLLFFDNTLKALGAFNATTTPIQPAVAKLGRFLHTTARLPQNLIFLILFSDF